MYVHHSVMSNSATLRIVACQAPQSMGFSRQQYWSGLLFPALGDLLNPEIEPRSPTLQADSLSSEPIGKHICKHCLQCKRPQFDSWVWKTPWRRDRLPRQYSWASLVAQSVRNPPAIWETWVWSLGWEDSLEEGMATHSSILASRIPMDRGACRLSPWDRKELDTTEQLSTAQHVLIIVLFLVFWESSVQFPQWLHQDTFPLIVYEDCLSSTSLTTFITCFFFLWW